MNLKNIQKISSVIPFYSTFFVLIVTMVKLKRYGASVTLWINFALTFFLSGIAASLLLNIVNQNDILKVASAAIVLGIANFRLVHLQEKAAEDQQRQSTSNIANQQKSWSGTPGQFFLRNTLVNF